MAAKRATLHCMRALVGRNAAQLGFLNPPRDCEQWADRMEANNKERLFNSVKLHGFMPLGINQR